MPRPPRRKAPGDTIRLKREIAQADSAVRGLARGMATSGLADDHPAMRAMSSKAAQLHKTSMAKEDSLKQYRKAAPKGTHKSFAQGTEGFDGAALGETPPRVSIPRGNPTPDSLPSATGRPALAQQADGTENIRADYQCFEAGNTRPTVSSGGAKFRPAGVQSFDADKV